MSNIIRLIDFSKFKVVPADKLEEELQNIRNQAAPEAKGVNETFTSADSPAKVFRIVNGIITRIKTLLLVMLLAAGTLHAQRDTSPDTRSRPQLPRQSAVREIERYRVIVWDALRYAHPSADVDLYLKSIDTLGNAVWDTVATGLDSVAVRALFAGVPPILYDPATGTFSLNDNLPSFYIHESGQPPLYDSLRLVEGNHITMQTSGQSIAISLALSGEVGLGAGVRFKGGSGVTSHLSSVLGDDVTVRDWFTWDGSAADLYTSVTIGSAYIYRAGGTDVPVTDGGTGASTESGARANLGLTIGTHVQAYDIDLDDLADGSLTGSKVSSALADGSTKGVSSYSATYFTLTSGNVTPNLTSGLASGSQGGWLSSANWTTFNNKQSAITNSSDLRGTLSDENGTGAALFDGAISPTLTTPTITAASLTTNNEVHHYTDSSKGCAFVTNETVSRAHASAANLSFERTDVFSVSFWLKLGAASVNYGLVRKQERTGNFRGWSVFFLSTNKFRFELLSTGSNGLSVSTNNTFTSTTVPYHVVVTYDGSSSASGVKIYVNGTLEAHTVSLNNLSATTLNTVDFYLASDGAASFLNGTLYEVQVIKSRVLTQTDVTDAYTNGCRGRYATGTVVAHYPWDGSTDAKFLNDASQSGYDLTATNITQAGNQVSASLRRRMKELYPTGEEYSWGVLKLIYGETP